jgi:DNA (cytosine-5)-methyltransferase 1
LEKNLNTSELTAISLFSGCGGFDYGATEAGVKILWANDNDPVAESAYKSLLPDVYFELGDIRNINDIPAADILIGCYPCTGFSLAARRRWKSRADRDILKIEGNFLYREFLRILDANRPKYFFVENVRGMMTAGEGWFFRDQINGFEEHGYKVKHKVLNATDYGVAQSRNRVFIVGVREDIAKEFEYQFLPPTHGMDSGEEKLVLKNVIKDMPEWPEGEFLERKFHGHYLTRNRKRSWDQPSYTVVANAAHVPLHPGGEPMAFVEKDKWKLQGDFNRRISWREAARIQGLPDHINPGGNLEGMYRVIGNAVPPRFGEVLLEPIVAYEA